MGYRSDVAIVFYPERSEDMPALKLFVKENMPDEFVEKQGFFSYLIARLNNVKWYDSYPDVNVYSALFNEWEDMFMEENGATKFHYEFVRVGEEMGDIEERGTDNQVLHVSRVIQESCDDVTRY